MSKVMYNDLREYLAALEADGDLVRIKAPIDQDRYEASAILWELYDQQGPGVIFENIKGYEGKRVVSNHVGNHTRVGKLLGLPKNASFKEVRDEYFRHMDPKRWIKPQVIDRAKAPCKDVVLKGDDVNLFDFPNLKWQPDDGGPYITCGIVVTTDPKGTLGQNAAIYRQMVIGKNQIAMMISIMQDIGKHFARAADLKQATLKAAVCIGVDPYCLLAAETKLRAKEDEFALAGALKGAPIDLVKCETSDLLVPANAEIVLEGEIKIGERVPEGPFAEWMGYYEESESSPLFEVQCITHRKDPIYQMTTVAHGNSEGNFLFMFGSQYQFYNMIRENATWVDDVHLPMEGRLFTAVVSINKRYPYLGRQTLYKVFSTPPTANYLNMCIVVDQDVNIYDHREVMWAMSTKVDAERDVVVMPPISVTGFNPAARARVDVGDKLGVAICSKIGIDATSKTVAEGHERGFVQKVTMPAEILADVRRRWAEYGFKA